MFWNNIWIGSCKIIRKQQLLNVLRTTHQLRKAKLNVINKINVTVNVKIIKCRNLKRGTLGFSYIL